MFPSSHKPCDTFHKTAHVPHVPEFPLCDNALLPTCDRPQRHIICSPGLLPWIPYDNASDIESLECAVCSVPLRSNGK